MKYPSFLLFVLCVGPGLWLPAAADSLRLANGDHISGTVSGWAEGAVLFATPFGVLEVAPADISRLESDGVRALRTVAGEVLAGPVTLDPDAVTVTTESGAVRMEWASVAALAESLEALAPPLEPLEPAVPGDAPEAMAAEAEVPGEPETPAEAPRKWSGSVESGLNLRRGNTNTLDFNLSSELKRVAEGKTLTLKALAAYGEVEEILNTRKYLGEARWQVYPEERWYYYLLAGVERDDGRKLALRTNTALGLGRDFIKEERLSLSADIGLDYAWERWSPYTPAEKDAMKESRRSGAKQGLRTLAEGFGSGSITLGLDTLRQALELGNTYRYPLRDEFDREQDYLSLRGGANYQQTVFRESTISNALTVLANVNDFGEFRVNNEVSFATPLMEALKLKVSLRTSYDSLAEEQGADAWDNTFITGLRYEF